VSMVTIILYLIPVFIVYSFIRYYWVSNETLKTKYKLARLKDELTWLAISGEINHASKEYIHLYGNISKAIKGLHRFNFWVMLYLLIKSKHTIRTKVIDNFRKEVPVSSIFTDIHDTYHRQLITYIARKNIITVLITLPIWKKILDNYMSLNDNDTFNNTGEGTVAEEYSSFVYYIHNASAKSLFLG
jgi:hypothetical protein